MNRYKFFTPIVALAAFLGLVVASPASAGTATAPDVAINARTGDMLVESRSGDDHVGILKEDGFTCVYDSNPQGEDEVYGCWADVRNIRVNLGGGTNHFELSGEHRQVIYNGGAGADIVELLVDADVERDLRLRLGGGNNEVDTAGTIGRDLLIDARSGNDRINLSETTVGRNVRVNTAHGDDRIIAEFPQFANRVIFNTGPGADFIETADGSLGRSPHMNTGAGDDVVFNEHPSYSGRMRIDQGAGNDNYLQITPGVEDHNDGLVWFGRAGSDGIFLLIAEGATGDVQVASLNGGPGSDNLAVGGFDPDPDMPVRLLGGVVRSIEGVSEGAIGVVQ